MDKKQIKSAIQKKEAEYAKVFNPKAFIGVKKEEFKKQYKGKITFDIDAVWKWITDNRGSKPKNVE